jgi:hypothetical protein
MVARSLQPIWVNLIAMGLALVFVGCKQVQPITLACNAAPLAVYAGEHVPAGLSQMMYRAQLRWTRPQ